MTGRAKATQDTTGPGAMLTDGEMLLEVTDARIRKIVAGKRTMRVPERRLRDAKLDLDGDTGGAWVPFAEVAVLDVVRPVAYDEVGDDVPLSSG